MNRGEIWWADLPAQGERPVLILTRQAAIPLLTKVLVVPATRTVRGIPSEVPIGPDDGTPEECALSFDIVVTIAKASLRQRICTLGFDRMRQACRALRDAAEC